MPLKRTPMKASSKPLARTTPMKRGTVALATKKPMARGESQLARNVTPMRSRSKTNSNPRPATGEAKLCKGQPCYLRIPGVCIGGTETVVPCHSNSHLHGKGRGIKAHDRYTVPGCWRCHATLDQGRDLDKQQRHDLWDRAYEEWSKVRMEKYGI